MAVTNFDVSGLTQYIKQNEDVIIKSILRGGDFIPKMRMQTGIKTVELIHTLEVNPVFEDGSVCGYNPTSVANIAERSIVTGIIKSELEVCPETLLGTFKEWSIKISASAENRPFEEYLIERIIANVNKKLNKAIWLGDLSSLDTNLKWFDGLLTIAGADSDVVAESISAGASAYAGLLQVANSIPEEAVERGAYINVSPAIFNAFMQDLVSLNLYHFNPADGILGEMAIPGTNIIVRKVLGLTGSLDVLATYDDNLYFGTDLEGSREDVKAGYDEKEDKYWLRIKFNAGVNYAWSDMVVLGTFASAPVAVASVNGTLANIAANTAALADDDHVYKTKEQA